MDQEDIVLKRDRHTLENYGGFKITYRDRACDMLIMRSEILKNCYKIDKNYGVVIDIGAHIGGTALMAARLGAKVYSYEPEQTSFELLEKNIKDNGLDGLVKCFKMAVGSGGKKQKLYLHNNNFGAFSLYADPRRHKDYQWVDVISIRDVFEKNNIEKCGLLKLDCERAELPIIQDMTKDLLYNIEKIIVEIHDQRNVKFITELLEDTHKLSEKNVIEYSFIKK